MKSIFRTMVLMCFLSFIPSSLLADDFDLDVRPYLGGGIGAFNIDAGFGSSTSFGGFGTVGANLNKYIAVEVRTGASSDASVTVLGTVNTTSGVDWFVSYLAKPQFSVFGDGNIYGLIGATTLKTTFTAIGPGGSFAVSKTGTGFSFGGGFEYKLMNNIYVGAEWVQYASDADVNAVPFPGLDVWGASGVVRYQF